MSQPLCMFQLCLFLLSRLIICIFFSSESYEGMSQHINIYFLSVLQFEYLRFYMYSKKHFRMRLPEVDFETGIYVIFLVLSPYSPPPKNTT